MLEFFRPFVGSQDLLFVLFQLRRDVALGIDGGLLADVVGGRFVLVGVGDFDVLAEDFVEGDLEVGNAGALTLLRLVLGDPLLAARCQVAEPVEVAAVAVANDPASRRQ